jgi:serine/threonine-protein kinase
VFAGRYRVLRRIAAGGMGAVFEVLHLETQRRRALKVMLPELLENRQLRERFQMEARITANVESEYIVDVFDAGIDDATGMPFLVMELLNGEDLAKVVERAGKLSHEHAITYLRQIASALDKTHAAGIVHRDLKPENLFLTHREDGTPRVKILDFGISKVVTEAGTGASSHATHGLGTPLYMAPEQVLAQTISPATDRYALGLIAYTLLVGSPYWQKEAETFDNPITFVVHTSKGTTDSAVRRAALAGYTLPAAFDAWFQRATSLHPGARFGSAAEMVNELAEVLGVGHLPFQTASLGPDSTGTVVRIAHPAAEIAVAETMVARTAPGTGFDRKSTLGGRSSRRKSVLWLALGATTLAATALATAYTQRSRAPAEAPSSELKSTAAEPAAAASISVVAAPSASAENVAPNVATADSATPPEKAVSAAKNLAAAGKRSPAKGVIAPARKVSPPKYTRD